MLSEGARTAGFPITLTLEEDGEQFRYSHLTLTEVVLINSGSRDFKEFRLGITITSSERAVQFVASSPDRYHNVVEAKTVSPKHPGQEIDIVLKPFNRKDRYSFHLWLCAKENDKSPAELRLSTDEGVRFVMSPTSSDISGVVLEILKATAKAKVGIH